MTKIFTILIFIISSYCLHAQDDFLSAIDSLYDAKQYHELIQKAEKYLATENPNDFTTSKLEYGLANSYYKTGDFVTCWKYMQDAYTSAKKMQLKDSSYVKLYIDVAQRLGDYSFLAEEYKIGIGALDNAIELGKERLSNDGWRMGKLFHKAGAVRRIMTQFDIAIANLEEGQSYLPIIEEERRNYLSTVFLAEMAQVYNDNNRINKSIEIFKTLLEKAYSEDNKKRISIYNNNIGIAYERKGDFGMSEYHLRKSLEAKLDLYGEKTPKIIANYTNLARINTLLRRYEAADQYFQKLEFLIREVFEKDHVKNGDIYYNIGTSYYQQNRYEKALPHFRESVRIRKLHKEEDDLILAESEYLLGATLSKLKKYNEALPLLNRALKTRSNGIKSQDKERSHILTSLFETYYALGDETNALSSLEKAFEALNYSFAEQYQFEQIENPLALIYPLVQKLQYISKKYSQSPTDNWIADGLQIQLISDSLIQYIKLKYDDVATRRIATSTIQDLNEALIHFNHTIYSNTSDQRYLSNAFKVLEKSNNTFLYEAIAEEVSSDKFGLPFEILDQKSKLQDSITILHQKLESIPIDIRTQSKVYASNLSKLNECKKELYALIKTIEKEHPKYFESIYTSPEVNLSDIQSKLKEDEIILSYFSGNEQVYAILLSTKNQEFHALGKSRPLEKAITEFLDALNSKRTSTTYLESSKLLYNYLIAPMRIPKNKALSIIADDRISLIPFEMLINERTNLPLLLTNVITYHYSNSLKFEKTKKKRGRGLVAMAPIFEDKSQPLFAQNLNLDDRFRSEISYLPESEDEVNAIGELFNGTVFLGGAASETAFKNTSKNKALLHLATHGFVDNENPDFSRLYFNTKNDSLNDGKLHAHEIVNLDLSADLVTLSACNTGVGKIQNGEGISSLGRAFAYANCPNQLISLWPANDKSTTQLMTYYYTNLKKGMGKSTALTEAKRKYLSTAPEIFKHPYYWAGFVYYGKDTPLQIGAQWPTWLYAFSLLLLIVFFYVLLTRKSNNT